MAERSELLRWRPTSHDEAERGWKQAEPSYRALRDQLLEEAPELRFLFDREAGLFEAMWSIAYHEGRLSVGADRA